MLFYHIDDIPDDLKSYFEPVPQIGLESTLEEYVQQLVAVFREVRRVLHPLSFLTSYDDGETPQPSSR